MVPESRRPDWTGQTNTRDRTATKTETETSAMMDRDGDKVPKRHLHYVAGNGNREVRRDNMMQKATDGSRKEPETHETQTWTRTDGNQ